MGYFADFGLDVRLVSSNLLLAGHAIQVAIEPGLVHPAEFGNIVWDGCRAGMANELLLWLLAVLIGSGLGLLDRGLWLRRYDRGR